MYAQNRSLLEALQHCLTACEHCATACLLEQDVKTMAHCIQLDRDCADFCALTARCIARGSVHATALVALCAEVCKACGDECARHAHMPHCKTCAEACHRCEQACRAGLVS